MTDGGDPALSASTEVTITVNDVNEAPTVAEGKELKDQTQMAGDSLSWTVDLTGLFEDQDDDDSNLVYSLKPTSLNGVLGADGKPIALGLTVTRGTDDDGNLKIEGVITSTTAIAAGQQPGSFDVTIVATDDDDDTPLSGEASFKVHVDDRNDEITGITLYQLNEDGTDGDKNILYVVDVDENHDAEVNLGRITIQDADRAEHPHGQHTVKVDDDRFDIKVDAEGGLSLILKAGKALDREEEKAITLTITAEDKAAGAEKSTFTQLVTVDINDVNDAPEGRTDMGNWWVTIDEDLDAEDVTAGQWLSFQLESEDGDDPDFYPAFTDEDSGKNGTLTYELVSAPSWLMIDKDGVIQNKKGMLPASSGTQMITVKATDGGDASAMINFHLTWAISGADNEDNDEPTLRITRENEIDENTAEGVLVATFTVNDDDSDLPGHPFAPGKPTITGAVNADNSGDINNGDGYAGAFTLKQNGNVWEVRTTKAAAALLDYENVDEITITVQVSDGVITDAVTEEIDVDINDVNEKPVVLESYDGPGSEAVTVEQSEDAKEYLWIKAHELWGDMDDRQDAGDMNFDASSNVPWITIVYKGAWEDLEDGPDGDSRTADDNVAWGTIREVTASDAGTEPDDSDDYVIVVEIDRTKANNKQADVAKGGEITLTARDEGGATGEHKVKVSVTDENLDIGADAVTISSVNEREGMTLTAKFDEEKDPDLVGSPEAYLVIYTWSATADEDGTGGTVLQSGASNTYTMTQADVGMYISVSVTYRELEVSGDETDFTATPQNAGSAVTDDPVLNTPDKGDVKFNLYVNEDRGGLTAEVEIIDEDGIDTTEDNDPDDDDGTPPVYTWQSSVNGVSGWKAVVEADDANRSDPALTLADGDGDWYRLVVTYTDQQGVAERHVSNAIQVGELDAPEDAPTLSATSGTVVGSTLRVNDPGSKVEWQQQHGTGDSAYWSTIATGNTLAITSDHEGAVLRAVVSHSGDDGLEATTVLAVNGGSAIAALPNTAPTAVKETHYIDQDMDKDATVTEARGTIDVASLFEDLDGDKLTFTVTAGPGSDLVTETDGANNAAIWMSANAQGLMSFDASTGELVYVTADKSGHDGDGSDGGGNVVTLTVQASDGEATTTTMVGVRLNVAPGEEVTGGNAATVAENTQAAGTLLTLNVQDENSPMHDYGKYTWAIKEGDARFTITADKADSSQAVLAVAKANQEFETAGEDGTITLTLVATEVGNTANVVEHKVTITVTNDATDDPADPDEAPEGNTVPGLKDNEESDSDDKADGTDGDGSTTPDDTDGGWYEPPADPGMMVIDNDLLDSFVLAIDDIDAA